MVRINIVVGYNKIHIPGLGAIVPPVYNLQLTDDQTSYLKAKNIAFQVVDSVHNLTADESLPADAVSTEPSLDELLPEDAVSTEPSINEVLPEDAVSTEPSLDELLPEDAVSTEPSRNKMKFNKR